MLPNPEAREVTLQDFIKIIQKRLTLIIAFFLIIPSTATIAVFTTRPIYRAVTSIIIERATPKVTKFEEIVPSGQYTYGLKDMQYYQTQYKILGSRALAERVFDELQLSKDPDFQGLKDPVEKLHQSINIEPVRNSQFVLICVEDTNPLRSASVANTLAKAYIRQEIESRGRTTREAVGWLELQLTDIKKKMQEAEEALNKYIQENRIVTTPDIEKKTQTLLETLKQTKAKLETDLAEARKRYKEKHPKMVALNAQLVELTEKIEQETDRLLDLSQKMVPYNVLKKESESIQQLYTSILTRAKEAAVSEKLEVSSITIVDPARPPQSPFKPKKAKTIFTSIFISLFAGVVLSFFLEYLDSSIRTAEDVSFYVNLPFLGYIPSVHEREAKTHIERDLICYQNPKSTITESYRAVRTSLLFAAPEDRPLKSILIISALPKEGKTFMASNLSCAFCQINERVVLLDMDMRRPRLHKDFGIEQGPGLSNFLTTNINLETVIKTVFVPNLSLITSGPIPPNPSELLSSGKVRLLFEELKSKFDRIIVDSPPLLSVADASLLANIVDGVILVVKGASTRLEAVVRAKKKILESKGGKIIGVVVNNIEPEKEDRYYYYYHYYYSEGDKKREREKKKIEPAQVLSLLSAWGIKIRQQLATQIRAWKQKKTIK